MKNENAILLLGAAIVGGYFLLKGTPQETGGGGGSYYGSGLFTPTSTIAAPTAPPPQYITPTIQPMSISTSDLFVKSSETAPDRFIVAPGSGGGGVYDRYAQQSIRTQTATVRRIFGTPGVTPKRTTSTVKPEIKAIFRPNMSFG